ncbi:MAG: P-loop NTPase fold protein [Aquabacterium sp.]|uniref:KAP family P-loop NTPase fold protein n=1 Tax=Aquabacterium sp. TaxID=1872578 RepID=UPI002720C103|nr:P-loop NTPase fold protein [Aquabacterium sp.]MDO9004587.1 P-loop NTPase fold protein [Aquabacterium sp.]
MNTPIIPLFLRPPAFKHDDMPFQGDAFERAELAKRLTGFLTRLPDGGVIAIDAPWGEGKTWFGRHWHASLLNEKYRTIYIDCFQRDYVEDPFLMIAGELVELTKLNKSKTVGSLLKTGTKLGATLLPTAAKIAVNSAGHWLLGKTDLADDLAKAISDLENDAASKLEDLISKRLSSYEDDKKTVENFKDTLEEFSKEKEEPVIIFLDELDRCRPDFAVKTVERIKHFFEVPGIVFVLLMNRKQLAAAVEGIYGSRIDSNAYLAKFVQLSLNLPKKLGAEEHSPDDNKKHCEATLSRYRLLGPSGRSDFVSDFGSIATLLKMSLRDVENGVALYSFAHPLNQSEVVAAWPIALKIHNPDLFRRVSHHEIEAHKEAGQLAKHLKSRNVANPWIFDIFIALHACGLGDFQTQLSDEANQFVNGQGRWKNPKTYMSWLFSRFDLNV